MKATPYRTVRDGVISRMGIDPAQPLMASQATALAEYLTTAAATAWTFFDWPEVYLTEARTPAGDGFQTGVYTYESDYVGTTSYIGRAVQGSQFSDPVWRIKRVTTTAAGDLLNIDTAANVAWDDRTTATYIETSANEAAEDEFPYIPLVAQGLKPIGTVLKIYDRNPHECGSQPLTKTFCHVVTDDRILITDTSYTAGEPVWVEFSLPQPRFTATAFNSSTAYAAGDLVYYNTTGDCYEAIADTTGNLPTNEEFWLRHRIPAFLADYLKFYALAETLSEDGQMDKANYQFARAEGILQQRMDDAWLRKGEVRRYSASFQ
jgi:hypothetical protein